MVIFLRLFWEWIGRIFLLSWRALEITFVTFCCRKLQSSGEGGSGNTIIRWINTKPAWDAWGRLDHSLKTGEPAFDEVHGTHVFEYLKNDAETGAIFNDAMTGFSVMTGHAVAEAYDFGTMKTLVDVGGGHGAFLSTILAKYPTLSGVVYDLPEVVAGAPAVLGDLGVAADEVGDRVLETAPELGLSGLGRAEQQRLAIEDVVGLDQLHSAAPGFSPGGGRPDPNDGTSPGGLRSFDFVFPNHRCPV